MSSSAQTDHSQNRRCWWPSRAALVCWALAVARLPDAAFGHGALHERIAELSVALVRQPDDAGLHFQLAELNCQHGDWVAALSSLARVDQLAPGRFPSDLVRGRAALGAGQVPEAKAALDRFLAAHPGHAQALVLRARAFERLGKNEPCLADYRAALAASAQPEPDLFQEIAVALAFRGREGEAVRVLSAGIDRLGAVPSLVLKAMDLEIATKQFDAALSRVDAMQKSAPRPEPWMARRASVLAQAGRIEESRAAWQALVEHLTALPNLERGSHAMSKLAEDARQALSALDGLPPAAPPSPVPAPRPTNPQ